MYIQGSETDIDKYPFSAICHLLREAGEMLRSVDAAERENVTVKDGCANYVTEVDVKIQQFLKTGLKVVFPTAVFFAEENDGENRSVGALTIYLDPIDGTSNFVRGCREVSISVAIAKEGEPIFGAIYLPYADEMFTAEKGKGAFLNGTPIHVSDRKIGDALTIIGTAFYYKDQMGEKSMAIAKELFSCTADIRRYGSAAMEMCYVACGRAEIQFEMRLYPWDYMAGALIVQEAGGTVTDLKGDKISYDSACSILCTNAQVHEDVLKIGKKYLDT